MDREQRFLSMFYTYREVNQAFFHVMARVAQRHGLTPLQLIVLRILEEFPGIRLTELSVKLHLGNSTASGIIDRMYKAGLVLRERTVNDRRAMMLKLSEKGVALWEESNATRTKLLQPLMSLSDEDQRHFLRIQQQIIHILKNISEDDLHD